MNRYKTIMREAREVIQTKKQKDIREAVLETATEVTVFIDEEPKVFKTLLVAGLMSVHDISESTARRWIDDCRPVKSRWHGRAVYDFSKTNTDVEPTVVLQDATDASSIEAYSEVLKTIVEMKESLKEIGEFMSESVVHETTEVASMRKTLYDSIYTLSIAVIEMQEKVKA